ncbi:MAG: SusC/RagA family TonB-linked outer membrane protein, partial [Chryseobacterium sp.]|nr:SusC/RagA family TonB-linked outer membrane protein [Candidatus Chryseobacterium enterohippi]
MKKLTIGVLALVLSSSLAVAHAQEKKKDSVKTQNIEEVVVTALGIKREKKSLGYASQEIKSGALGEGTTNTGNIASQLSGKVAGLNVTTNNNFGGSSNLLIRGVKTLSGGNPLIVIDGSPVNNTSTQEKNVDYGNALSDINQDDIESINVLKGAAASALYGERGLNGVIVITTKNGKGKDDGSWGVTLSSSMQIGFIDKTTFPEYQTRYGAGYSQKFGSLSNGTPNVNFGADASWGPKFDPNLLVYQWDAYDPTSPNYGKATPWVAAKHGAIDFFENPTTFSNSVSLEKGEKGKNINFTYENMRSGGLMPNSKINKNNFSLKVNYDFTPKLHSSFYSTMTLQETLGRGTTGYSDNMMSGFRQWWQTNVDVKEQERAYFANVNPAIASAANNYGNVTWNRKSAANGAPAYWNNPYFQVYENTTTDKRFRSFSYAQVTYDLLSNISLTGKVSYDRSNLLAENRLAVGSVAQPFGLSGNDVGSGYARRDVTRTETNYDLMANYKFNITDDINLSGVVGGNIRRNYLNSMYASTEGGLVVRGLYSLSNSAKPNLAPAEDEWITETNSGYVTASFDFYKKFYVDGTWRVDKSSTLAAGNNVYNYPSITGSAIMSEILNTKSWMNFWKLRANYAEVGGTADPYMLEKNYRTAGILSGTGIYGSILSEPNPGLKPQRSKEFEIGTEAHFLKDRITLDVAYYKTKTIDQIITMPVSSGTGYTGKIVNAGRIDNKGIEVQLGITPVKSSNFTWTMDANWSKNKNEVVDLYPGITNLLLNSFQGGVSLNARVGEAWGTLIGSDYVYLNGQKVIDPDTGIYATKSNQILGNTTPDWIGGFRNSFNYKGFTLSFLIDVRKGGDIFSTDMYYGMDTGLYKESAIGDYRDKDVILPGVLPNGNPNNIALSQFATGSNYGYETQPAKEFVYDGSYVKLREASIGYILPKSFLAGTGVFDAKISIVARNLWIIHKNLPHADPEAMVGGGINSYGWSIGSMPIT